MSAPMEKTSVPGIYRRGGRYVVAFRDATGNQRRDRDTGEQGAPAAGAGRAPSVLLPSLS